MNEFPLKTTVFELGQQLKSAFSTQTSNTPPSTNTNEPPETTNTETLDPRIIAQQRALEKANTDLSKKVEINTLKQEIGQDRAYIERTLKNKLSEYNLPLNTQLGINKGVDGKIYVEGSVLNSLLERISFDLNQDTHFIKSYNEVNKQKPTLDYADNVVKLSKAYGTNNKLFSSLLSEKQEFNQLKDITLRYQHMQSQRLIENN